MFSAPTVSGWEPNGSPESSCRGSLRKPSARMDSAPGSQPILPPPPLLPSASARCGARGNACVRVREGRLGVRPGWRAGTRGGGTWLNQGCLGVRGRATLCVRVCTRVFVRVE